MRAGAQALFDVGHGIVRTDIAGGHVGHGIAAG